jgi:hypothetical protein
MLQYTIGDCWNLVQIFLEKFRAQQMNVRGLILYNSMVRGDFVDGRSDIDMMAVVYNRSEGYRLKELHTNFCKNHGCSDEPEFRRAKDLIPFQLFIYTVKEFSKIDYGIYYEDLVQNHTVLYGEDVAKLIKRPNLEVAAKTFVSNALISSKSWDNPSQEVMKRHLKWMKFYPAYLAIETIKAVLLSRGIVDFNRKRLISNIDKVPDFKGKKLFKRVLNIYLRNETREMSQEELKQTYRQIHRLIRHAAQLCKV